MSRINNKLTTTDVVAIYTYYGCLRPQLGVVKRTSDGEKQETIYESEIADFLNLATDIKNGGKNRTIDPDLEVAIIRETNGVIQFKNDQYHYEPRITIQTYISSNFLENLLSFSLTSPYSRSPSLTVQDWIFSRPSGEKEEHHIKDAIDLMLENESPPVRIISPKRKSNSHSKWWDDKSNFNKIVKIAENLLLSYPKARIYSLGQSPAWIIKAGEILSQEKAVSREFGYIPFSGSFLEREQEDEGDFYIGGRPLPSRELQISYRDVLRSIRLSPREIIEQAAKGKKTVVLEYTNSGRSVASFVLVLFEWAKEEGIIKELKKSINIVTFARQNSGIEGILPLTRISIINADIYIACKNLWGENKLLVALANSIDEGPQSDRLVPSHHHTNWSSVPAPLTDNIDIIKMLTEQLQQAVLKYCGKFSEKNNVVTHLQPIGYQNVNTSSITPERTNKYTSLIENKMLPCSDRMGGPVRF